MPEYLIVSDIDNIIKYGEIHEVNREEVANHRARLEVLKAQKADIEAEIAKLEELIQKDEYIVKLADQLKESAEPNSEEVQNVAGEE